MDYIKRSLYLGVLSAKALLKVPTSSTWFDILLIINYRILSLFSVLQRIIIVYNFSHFVAGWLLIKNKEKRQVILKK
jgi:hypothetical protein